MKNQRFSKEQRSWGLVAFTVIVAGAIFIALLLHLSEVYGWIKTFLGLFTPFYIGFAIAYLLNPVLNFWEEKILKKMKKPKAKRTVSVLITYTIFLAILGGAIAYLLPLLFKNITELVNAIPGYYDSMVKGVNGFIDDHPAIEEFYLKNADKINGILAGGVEGLTSSLSGLLSSVANITIKLGGGVINTFVGIIISIYLLMEKEKLIAQLKKVLTFLARKEDRYEKILTVGRITHEKTLNYLTARLLDSLIVAVITYIFMLIFKVPYALISALSVGIFNTIPYFGSWLGAIPPAIIVLISKPTMFIPYLIFILLLEQLDGNVIGPKIQGKQLGLSALWVIFAIFLFGGLFGFLGMLLGVPFFAVIYYFVNAFINDGLNKQGKSAKTSDYAHPEDRDIINEK